MRGFRHRGYLDKHTRDRFLQALENFGCIADACRASGYTRQTWLNLKKRDPVFARKWDEARERALDRLEEEAWRRAHEGDVSYVVSHGRVVKYRGKPLVERKRSDQLLQFMLKGHRPAQYRENIDLTSKGKPLPAVNVIVKTDNGGG